MAKKEVVKVDSFRNFVKFMPTEKTINFKDTEIKIKQYLSMKDKELVIELLKSMSFNESDNGLLEYSPTNRDMAFVFLIMKYFTNINISKTDDSRDVYDIAVGSGLFDTIINNIPEEEIGFITKHIDNYVDLKLKEIANRSQFLDQLKEIINDAIEKMPKEMDMKVIAEELGKLDKSKVDGLMDIMNKVTMKNTKK